MEGSPCPTNSAYDYAYAKTSKLAIRLLISRAGMRCDEISTGYTSVKIHHEINNNHHLMNSDHLHFTLIKITRMQKTPV